MTAETTREKAIRVMADVLDGFTGKISTPETEAMRAFDALLEHVGPVMAEVGWEKSHYTTSLEPPEGFWLKGESVNVWRQHLIAEQKAKK